jgi:hypothetical protein
VASWTRSATQRANAAYTQAREALDKIVAQEEQVAAPGLVRAEDLQKPVRGLIHQVDQAPDLVLHCRGGGI